MTGAEFMTPPPSRPEARRRLGTQTANELGAPVDFSIPGQLPGRGPHQQGRDTKMTKLSYCGIDVSKDRLDVVVLPERRFSSVSNDTAGWAELVARLRLLDRRNRPRAQRWLRAWIIRALLAAGMSVRRINPYKLRQLPRPAGSWRRTIGSMRE